MDLASGITLAYERRWSMINTFTVQFAFNGEKLKTIVTGLDDLETDDINVSVVSVTTPDFTNDPIESFIANRWVIQNGKDSLYRFTITFKDFDSFNLYKKFMQIYKATKDNYFDDISMTVIITKDADWLGEDNESVLFTFNKTLIEGVSNLSFSNDTENQIAEFTVSFKCTQPLIGDESPFTEVEADAGAAPAAGGGLLDTLVGAISKLF